MNETLSWLEALKAGRVQEVISALEAVEQRYEEYSAEKEAEQLAALEGSWGTARYMNSGPELIECPF
jgi:hypothetical protein